MCVLGVAREGFWKARQGHLQQLGVADPVNVTRLIAPLEEHAPLPNLRSLKTHTSAPGLGGRGLWHGSRTRGCRNGGGSVAGVGSVVVGSCLRVPDSRAGERGQMGSARCRDLFPSLYL